MAALLDAYVDVSFIDAIAEMAPAIGAGVLLGIIFAIIGWLWGFVVRLGRFEV